MVATLNQYLLNCTNTTGKYTNPYDINIVASIPEGYRLKVETVVKCKGYNSYQEYLTALFNEHKDLKELLIPFEILKNIEEDYTSVGGGAEW